MTDIKEGLKLNIYDIRLFRRLTGDFRRVPGGNSVRRRSVRGVKRLKQLAQSVMVVVLRLLDPVRDEAAREAVDKTVVAV